MWKFAVSLGHGLLWLFKLALAVVLVLGTVALLPLFSEVAMGESHRLSDAAVTSWVILVGLTVILVLLYFLLRSLVVLFRSLGAGLGVFGSSPEARIVSFGIVALIAPKAVGAALSAPIVIVQQLVAELPRTINRFIDPRPQSTDLIVTFDQAFVRLAAMLQGIGTELGRELALITQMVPLADTAVAIALWVVFGHLLSGTGTGTASERDGSRLAQLARSMSPERKYALALAAVFSIGVYFSIAAIVAIPWLTEDRATHGPTRDTLQKALELSVLKADAFESEFPAAFGDKSPLDPVDKKLAALEGDSQPKPSVDAAESKASTAVAAQLRTAKLNLSQMKSSRERVIEQWKQVRKGVAERQAYTLSTALSAFETETQSGMSGQERATFYRDTLRAASAQLEQLYHQARDCKRVVGEMDRFLEINAIEMVGDLERLQKERGSPQDARSAFDSPFPGLSLFAAAPLPWRCSTTPLAQVRYVPPEPGSGWGPFGLVANWLLRTKSRAMVLITGMLGFGILGAAISTFVKTQQPGDVRPVVGEVAKVLIRGLSAALVVFLAVKGGLAIFAGGGDQEPNAYVLFLTCLIGAVYSEDVWRWARRKFGESFPGQDRDDPKAKQKGLKSRQSKPDSTE